MLEKWGIDNFVFFAPKDSVLMEEEEGKCKDFGKYLELLYLVLDNEGTEDDERYLMAHLEECAFCLKTYQLESEVRKLLKTKLARKDAPHGLAEAIKKQILLSS